jgi:segregation and condensation protein B
LSETALGDTSRDERTRKQVSMIEAALYVTGKPLDVSVLGSILNLHSEEKIRKLAAALKDMYVRNLGALEVLELSDGRYVMQLKPEYSKSVKRLATRQLLTPGPMKTLSYIALRQPVAQSHVVKVRGNLAYAHVRQLRDMGLISEEKLGRSKLLRTTPSFSDYFNLSQEPKLMKRQIQKIFEDLKLVQTGEAQQVGAQVVSAKPPQGGSSSTQPSEPRSTAGQ